MKKNSPSFFIVGAAKAGTTSLYGFLAQHPQVYMSPVKEPNHFASDIDLDALRPQLKKRLKAQDVTEYIASGMQEPLHRAYITDRNQYLSLFTPAAADKISGEASASYLYSNVAAKEIYAFNPDAKIIIILRNPVARAYSHYLMDYQLGFTDKDFKTALENDIKQEKKGWGASSLYLEAGLYFEQVKRYTDLFPASQILILLNEDLRKSKEETLKKVFDFLAIDSSVKFSSVKNSNKAVVPRNSVTRSLLKFQVLRITLRKYLKNSKLKTAIKKLIFSSPENNKPDEHINQELKDYFRSDILNLSKLIKRDLSEWM